MGPFEVACPTFGPLAIVGDRLNQGNDFCLRSNAGKGQLDYLIFLDSRGISRDPRNSLAERLIAHVSHKGARYLLLCRPLELTTWATLVNFIAYNELNPAKIVTNMGFVDFTPKKESILQEAIQQVDFFIGKGVAETHEVQDFVSSAGEKTALHSIAYSPVYRKFVEEIVIRQPTLIINTPLVDPAIPIERERPIEFFSALSDSNLFNHSISGADVIDLPNFDISLTYDAVHYTNLGNQVVFEAIKEHL